jgi:hypothetical protein
MELSRNNNRRSREVATRNRLADVQRLKSEVTDKRQSTEAEPANAGRLRNLISKLTK